MKKFFAIVMVSVMALTSVSVQHNMVRNHKSVNHGQIRHEMNVEKVGKKVAEELQLDEKTAEKFIPVYQQYCEAKQEVQRSMVNSINLETRCL